LSAAQIGDLHKLTADRPERQRELRVGAKGQADLSLNLRAHDVVLLSLHRID